MIEPDPERKTIFNVVLAVIVLVALLFGGGIDERLHTYFKSQESDSYHYRNR